MTGEFKILAKKVHMARKTVPVLILALIVLVSLLILQQVKINRLQKTMWYSQTSKVDGITAKISLDSTNIRFKKDFSVPIIIENHTNKPVQIDTSPDEVIEYPSEKSGGEYRERGSRCEISVEQQDSDGKLGFFSTTHRKVKAQNKGRNSFTIKPGKSHTLKFRISPWGPTYSAIPSTAVPGPAVIKGKLKILIEGQQLNVPLEPVRMNFVK